MQKGHHLQLHCIACNHPISFSLFGTKNDEDTLTCHECGKQYAFSDPVLKRQLEKFEKLCKQILESEEILSQTSVGIQVGERFVEVPYKLLLTRLNSRLSLEIGGHSVKIEFRLEPQKDLANLCKESK